LRTAPLPGPFVSERGAVFIPIAFALLVFTLMSAVVVDYGLQLVSRAQLQTAVDAAALAGATALAFDSYEDRDAAGLASSIVQSVAKRNLVWGSDGVVTQVRFENCLSTLEDGAFAPPVRGCVQVQAYRDTAHGNPVTALMGRLLGQETYDVRTAAMAEAKRANATNCLRPLAIPDRWTEADGSVWSATSTYDRYDPDKPSVLLPLASRDTYTPAIRVSPGTGLTMSENIRRDPVILRLGELKTPIAAISPWRYLPLDMTNGRLPRANTIACAATPTALDARVDIAAGDLAANAVEVIGGLTELINVRDPGARWNPDTLRVENSCAQTTRCASISPRIIAIGLYDPKELADLSHPGMPAQVVLRNIVGFFVESVDGTSLAGYSITGYITRYPGLLDGNPDTRILTDDSSFLRTTVLVG
jgi:Flp pilus assembly protein TadG